MHQRAVYLSFMLLLLWSTGPAQNRWQFVNPTPTGFNIHTSLIEPTGRIWLFGQYGTALISDDQGKTWQTLSNFNYYEDINDACLSGGNIWLAGQGGLILKSTDRGVSWIRKPSSTGKSLRKIQFLDAGTGWIMASDSLMLKTEDGGESWQPVRFNNQWSQNDFYFIDKNNGFLLTGYYLPGNIGWTAKSRGALYSTLDGGKTWLKRDSGSTKYSSISFTGSKTGYMSVLSAENGAAVLRTRDKGLSWDTAGWHWLDQIRFLDEKNAIGLMQQYIGISSDSGKNFNYTEMKELPASEGSWTSINSSGSLIVITGTEGNTLISSNAGKNWSSIKKSIDFYWASLRGVVFTDKKHGYTFGQRYLEALADEPVFLYTEDAGISWSALNSPDTTYISVLKAKDNLLLAGTELGKIYTSNDNGGSWKAVGKADNPGLIRDVHLISRDTLIFIADRKVYSTADGGLTWKKTNDFYVMHLKRLVMADSKNWFLLGSLGGSQMPCFRSIDGGLSWSAVNEHFTSMQFLNASTGFAHEGQLYKTTDGGSTWNAVTDTSKNIPGTQSAEISFFNDKTGWITHYNGTFFTSDGGTSWKREYGITGLLNWFHQTISVVSAKEAWAVGGNGFILHFISNTDGVEGEKEIEQPWHYRLYQNYPNPFNPLTTITYSIPKGSRVKIVLYDILGRQISILADEIKPAGVHSLKLDGAGLPSGMYIYKIQAGEFTGSKKLMLIK